MYKENIPDSKIVLFAVVLSILLVLCGRSNQKYRDMASEQKITSVFAPHYKVNIGGAIVGIWGEDICPDYAFSDARGTRNCIVQDYRLEIPVHFNGLDGKEVRELWLVIKQGDQINFRRPNGFIISA